MNNMPGDEIDVCELLSYGSPSLDPIEPPEPCKRGDSRDWRIGHGRHSHEKLYCHFWKMFMNPTGFSCAHCKTHPELLAQGAGSCQQN